MALSHRRFFLFSLLCALLAGLLLSPGVSGGFVFDDEPNIVNNPAIQMQSLDPGALIQAAFGYQPGGTTRVLPTVTFALDYWRGGGPDPKVFKVTNIAIHALTACVLAWFLRALLLAAGISDRRAPWAALTFALAWAIHPIQVSSVLYVVQRMQTLATLFLLLALWAYLRARLAQIEGRPGRTGWLLALLLWAVAFGCKEDAILLPAYALAMELTVLRFRAAAPGLSRTLRRGYLLATVAGAIAYLFVLAPHYWQWQAYPGRDFSSYERLLTQARVLGMYLWEIVLPLPSHMPFYYDWLQPSRGILTPWTTLPALLLVVILLAMAWRLRTRSPLFSLGIFWFFGAHFVTSNVVGLELAFEHRNHFALIGVVLALGSLIMEACARLRLRPAALIAISAVVLSGLGTATVARARTWDNRLGLAQASTRLAPTSARAWNSLCRSYFVLGGGAKAHNRYLDQAIAACSKGSYAAPYAVSNLTNLVVFKTIRGDITAEDWSRLQQRLNTVPMNPENGMAPWVLIYNASNGVALDQAELLKALATVSLRGHLKSSEMAGIGYFILEQLHQPDLAYPYFEKSVARSSPRDRLPGDIANDLRAAGRADLASALERRAADSRQSR